jgi:hypothetical protein
MRYGLIIFCITAFLIADLYHDGHYSKLLKSWKKYYQMAFIGFLGLSAYLFIKKHPSQSQNLLVHANELIKYMPIDKNAGDLISPILDFTNGSFMGNTQGQNTNNTTMSGGHYTGSGNGYETMNQMTPQQKRMMTSGKGATKRSVSETKKKFVASQQGWKCGKCHNQLTAWFEVDHVVRLEYGGSNEVDNLVALCRECHGAKTTMENL